jgi:hypothetical protein
LGFDFLYNYVQGRLCVCYCIYVSTDAFVHVCLVIRFLCSSTWVFVPTARSRSSMSRFGFWIVHLEHIQADSSPVEASVSDSLIFFASPLSTLGGNLCDELYHVTRNCGQTTSTVIPILLRNKTSNIAFKYIVVNILHYSLTRLAHSLYATSLLLNLYILCIPSILTIFVIYYIFLELVY